MALEYERIAALVVADRAFDRDVAVSGGSWTAAIATAIREAVAEEREACAKEAEAHGRTIGDFCWNHENAHGKGCWNVIAAAIRARESPHA